MLPENSEHHIMVHQGTHSSGAEEWYCPACGRRFLMSWPPDYKRVILEPGDENAVHTGGKGGVQMNNMQANSPDLLDELSAEMVGENKSSPVQNAPLFPDDGIRLVQWEEWLENVGFEEWWVKDD
jgi:hypothetical protein